MKKFFILAAAALMMAGTMSLNAQNKFKGVVKYKVTAVGQSADQALQYFGNAAEIKVMGEQISITNPSATLFTFNQMINCIRQNGRTMSMALDYSMILTHYNITLTSYQGDGKILQRNTVSQGEIDSLTIPCTEGYYIEYVNETKKIAGVDAKLARIHAFDQDGVDHPTEMWYSPDMGPEANFIFQGVKGIPMEYTIKLDQDNSITFTADEVVKGKVKDTDFLMPAGFKALSDDEMKAFMEELSEEMKYLRGGDDDE